MSKNCIGFTLQFTNFRYIVIGEFTTLSLQTRSWLWNDLPPELRTFSLPPPSSLQIIKHHLQHPPLSVTPRVFHSKLKSHLFKLSFPDSPDSISSHSPPKLPPP